MNFEQEIETLKSRRCTRPDHDNSEYDSYMRNECDGCLRSALRSAYEAGVKEEREAIETEINKALETPVRSLIGPLYGAGIAQGLRNVLGFVRKRGAP